MLTLAPIRLIAMNTDAGALHGHHQIYRESLKLRYHDQKSCGKHI